MAVWGDDPTTEEIDGLREGELFGLKLRETTGSSVKTVGEEWNITRSNLIYHKDEFIVVGAVSQVSIPLEFCLSQNYPNPFNETTRITFGLAEDTEVSVDVFDLRGRLVEKLVDSSLKAGHHAITWDAGSAPGGIYIVQLRTRMFIAERKAVLLK